MASEFELGQESYDESSAQIGEGIVDDNILTEEEKKKKEEEAKLKLQLAKNAANQTSQGASDTTSIATEEPALPQEIQDTISSQEETPEEEVVDEIEEASEQEVDEEDTKNKVPVTRYAKNPPEKTVNNEKAKQLYQFLSEDPDINLVSTFDEFKTNWLGTDEKAKEIYDILSGPNNLSDEAYEENLQDYLSQVRSDDVVANNNEDGYEMANTGRINLTVDQLPDALGLTTKEAASYDKARELQDRLDALMPAYERELAAEKTRQEKENRQNKIDEAAKTFEEKIHERVNEDLGVSEHRQDLFELQRQSEIGIHQAKKTTQLGTLVEQLKKDIKTEKNMLEVAAGISAAPYIWYDGIDEPLKEMLSTDKEFIVREFKGTENEIFSTEFEIDKKIAQMEKDRETTIKLIGSVKYEKRLDKLKEERADVLEEYFAPINKNINELNALKLEQGISKKRIDAINKQIKIQQGLKRNLILDNPEQAIKSLTPALEGNNKIIMKQIMDTIDKDHPNASAKEKFDLFFLAHREAVTQNLIEVGYAKEAGMDEMMRPVIEVDIGWSPYIKDAFNWKRIPFTSIPVDEGTMSLTDKQKEAIKGLSGLNAMLPIYLTNRVKVTDDSFWDGFWDGMGSFMLPNLYAGDTNMTQKRMSVTQRFIDEYGVDNVDKKTLEAISGASTPADLFKEDFKLWNPFTWDEVDPVRAGQTTGMLAGVMVEMLPAMVATAPEGGAGGLAVLARIGNTLKNAKKFKRLGKASARYFDLLKESSSLAKYSVFAKNPLLKNAAFEGLRFELVGEVFQTNEDTFNFWSGFAGGYLGGLTAKGIKSGASSLFTKTGAEDALARLGVVFGDKAKGLANSIIEIQSRGIGEVGEEIAQEMVETYRQTPEGKSFFAELRKKFPDAKSIDEFLITTYLMGSMFGGMAQFNKLYSKHKGSGGNTKVVDEAVGDMANDQSLAIMKVVEEESKIDSEGGKRQARKVPLALKSGKESTGDMDLLLEDKSISEEQVQSEIELDEDIDTKDSKVATEVNEKLGEEKTKRLQELKKKKAEGDESFEVDSEIDEIIREKQDIRAGIVSDSDSKSFVTLDSNDKIEKGDRLSSKKDDGSYVNYDVIGTNKDGSIDVDINGTKSTLSENIVKDLRKQEGFTLTRETDVGPKTTAEEKGLSAMNSLQKKISEGVTGKELTKDRKQANQYLKDNYDLDSQELSSLKDELGIKSKASSAQAVFASAIRKGVTTDKFMSAIKKVTADSKPDTKTGRKAKAKELQDEIDILEKEIAFEGRQLESDKDGLENEIETVNDLVSRKWEPVNSEDAAVQLAGKNTKGRQVVGTKGDINIKSTSKTGRSIRAIADDIAAEANDTNNIDSDDVFEAILDVLQEGGIAKWRNKVFNKKGLSQKEADLKAKEQTLKEKKNDLAKLKEKDPNADLSTEEEVFFEEKAKDQEEFEASEEKRMKEETPKVSPKQMSDKELNAAIKEAKAANEKASFADGSKNKTVSALKKLTDEKKSRTAAEKESKAESKTPLQKAKDEVSRIQKELDEKKQEAVKLFKETGNAKTLDNEVVKLEKELKAAKAKLDKLKPAPKKTRKLTPQEKKAAQLKREAKKLADKNNKAAQKEHDAETKKAGEYKVSEDSKETIKQKTDALPKDHTVFKHKKTVIQDIVKAIDELAKGNIATIIIGGSKIPFLKMTTDKNGKVFIDKQSGVWDLVFGLDRKNEDGSNVINSEDGSADLRNELAKQIAKARLVGLAKAQAKVNLEKKKLASKMFESGLKDITDAAKQARGEMSLFLGGTQASLKLLKGVVKMAAGGGLFVLEKGVGVPIKYGLKAYQFATDQVSSLVAKFVDKVLYKLLDEIGIATIKAVKFIFGKIFNKVAEYARKGKMSASDIDYNSIDPDTATAFEDTVREAANMKGDISDISLFIRNQAAMFKALSESISEKKKSYALASAALMKLSNDVGRMTNLDDVKARLQEEANPTAPRHIDILSGHMDAIAVTSGMRNKIKGAIKDLIYRRHGDIHRGMFEDDVLAHEMEVLTEAENIALTFMTQGTKKVPEMLKMGKEQRAIINGLLQNPTQNMVLFENKIYERFSKYFEAMTENGQLTEEAYVTGYMPQVWDLKGKEIGEVKKVFDLKNPNTKKRYIQSYEAGIKLGLTPKTLKASDLLRVYSKNYHQTTANKGFVEALYEMVTESGQRLVVPADSKAPPGYVKIDNPAFTKYVMKPNKDGKFELTEVPVMAHPEIAGYVNALASQGFDNKGLKALYALTQVVKKINLSISFFHHWALSEAATATPASLTAAVGMWNPRKIMKEYFTNENPMEVFRNIPLTKEALEAGLMIESSPDISREISDNLFNRAVRGLDNAIFNKTEISFKDADGKMRTINLNPVKGTDKLVKKWDGFLWDYLHNGFKLTAFQNMKTDWDVKNPNATKEQRKLAYREIAGQVNDTFGGQAWEMLAVSKKTLQTLQLLLLSPDWTVSTGRQFLSMFAGFSDSKTFRALRRDGNYGKRPLYTIDGIYNAVEKLDVANDLNSASTRRNMGLRFWSNACLRYYLLMNVANYVITAWSDDRDREDERDRNAFDKAMDSFGIIPDGTVGKFMYENDRGNKFALMGGRSPATNEKMYYRMSKQFLEVPEMLEDPLGRLASKASPNLRFISDVIIDPKTIYDPYRTRGEAALDVILPFSSKIFNPDENLTPLTRTVSVAVGVRKGFTQTRLKRELGDLWREDAPIEDFIELAYAAKETGEKLRYKLAVVQASEEYMKAKEKEIKKIEGIKGEGGKIRMLQNRELREKWIEEKKYLGKKIQQVINEASRITP
tara:strand:- start:6165 stop:14582 length:8418 start_codon:yes stop_codon:yes gene_type:complete